ncbi:unnamed protein product [Caenorhabditis angaria]|uniref:RCC1-like domain-containing protein n=1 Tax=Caenorhabditis angaria TaxID=860376 RepID=A0A9P1N457_9PELO|nr:unnamed protein product [Caenorhabditis angaria]
MMENPYCCSLELDELGADDAIIDYSVFSDDSFLLILLLTSKGETQAYLETGKDTKPRKNVVDIRSSCGISAAPLTICIGSQAAYVVFGLADGNLLVTPIKTIIDVTWGGSSWSTTNVIDLSLESVDICLATPTCTKCFTSNFPPRSMAVVANKAGNILLVDLQLRKCVSELKAPQSLHEIEILLDENSIELLVTGFTGAQWIIPIERNGRGFREVLTTCVPADLQVLEPATMQFFASEACGVVALDTQESCVGIYSTFNALANSSKRIYKVPPETWMVHSSDNVLFTVSANNEIRSAVHFGLNSVRLEYSLIRTSTEWRPLGLVAMAPKTGILAGIFVINERGLVRVEQSRNLTLARIASEFIFRLQTIQISPKTFGEIANAISIDLAQLQSQIIPEILAARQKTRGKLSQKELAQVLLIAKVTNHNLSDLLKMFANESMAEHLLPEVMNAIQTNPSKHENLMQKVVEMFVKRAQGFGGDLEKIRECDSELASFLSRHESLTQGAMDCTKSSLWKSTQVLLQRLQNAQNPKSTQETSANVLSFFAKNGLQIWKSANATDKLQIMSLICNLDWCQDKLSEQDGTKLCALLAGFQRDVKLASYHEMCLRVAMRNSGFLPKPCQILALVSSIYILAEKRAMNPANLPDFWPISAGNNCAVAIAEDDRLLVWGNFTNQQQKAMDLTGQQNKDELPKPELNLPRVLEYPGGRPRAVSCGAEHILVLSASGQLSAWGGNKFGQCGAGRTFRLHHLQQIDGPWPAIKKISAGQFHSGFVCHDGSVWMMGWGIYGQLGRGTRENRNVLEPVKIGLGLKIQDIQCGRAHTVLLTENGQVLVAGSGSYGQHGTNEDVKKAFSFRPLLGPGPGLKGPEEKVTMIASSYFHSICVTESGRIFEWGRNPQEIKMRIFVMKKLKSAALKNSAENSTKINLNLPATIPRDDLGLREVQHFLDAKISAISCGLQHCGLITENGTLYMWGKSLDYQLGGGNKTERLEPHQVFKPENTKWTQITCGNNHSIGTTTEGTIFGWGKNDFAQSKDGRRFMPTVDDSHFTHFPTIIPDLKIRTQKSAQNLDESIDEDKIMEKIRCADITVIQAVSRHLSIFEPVAENLAEEKENFEAAPKYSGEIGPLCAATAFIHLISGDLEKSIRMVEYLKRDRNTTPQSLSSLSSLIWEVMANHEDVQTRKALCAAFKNVPMSDSLRKGKQIAQLWPTVWNDDDCQNMLSIDEKIAMLDGFTTVTKPTNCATIPSSSLEVSSRIRVFSECSHAEPAIVGSPPECSSCIDEWTEKVRATLGAQI